MTNWRALCEELHLALERRAETLEEDRLLDRSAAALRAALAQPEPEVGPTDQEIADAFAEGCRDGSKAGEPPFLGGARAVLARWGRPAPAPAGEVVHAAHVRRMCEIILGNTFGNGELDSLALLVGHHPDVLNASPAAEGEVAELINELRRICFDVAPCDADTITRAADLLERQAVPVPVASDTRYEFSIFDEDFTEQAAGSAPTYAQALSEGQHYLAQYQQDGPHTLEVRRVENLNPDAFPAPDGAPLQVLPEDAQVIEPTERTILVPARTPVPVSERPWEREGWCDEQGQCWMGDPGGGGFIPSWRLCRPEDAPRMKVSLPFNALPLPSGEVG